MAENPAFTDFAEYVRREAFPQVTKIETKECGCNYKTMDHGGVYWRPCKKHDWTRSDNLRLDGEE